jgi:hypothetical protein
LVTTLLNPGCDECYTCPGGGCTDCASARDELGFTTLSFTGVSQPADSSLGGNWHSAAKLLCAGSPLPPGWSGFTHTFSGWPSVADITSLACTNNISATEPTSPPGQPAGTGSTQPWYVTLAPSVCTGTGLAYGGSVGARLNGYAVNADFSCVGGVSKLDFSAEIKYGMAYVSATSTLPVTPSSNTYSSGGYTWTESIELLGSSGTSSAFEYKVRVTANESTPSPISVDFSTATLSDPLGFFNGVASLS